jgi:putative DNA primase/helicase
MHADLHGDEPPPPDMPPPSLVDDDDAVDEFHRTAPPEFNGPWFDPTLPLEGMDRAQAAGKFKEWAAEGLAHAQAQIAATEAKRVAEDEEYDRREAAAIAQGQAKVAAEEARKAARVAMRAAKGLGPTAAPAKKLPTGPITLKPDGAIDATLVLDATESSLALAFIQCYRGQFLHCKSLNSWFEWSGSHWRADSNQRAFHHCVALARQAAVQATGSVSSLSKASFARGIETISSAEPEIARSADQFNRDHFLFATPDGTIELKTGTLRESRPEDMITKCGGCSPAAGTPSRWLEFLFRIFDDDATMVDYIQDWMGYSLTGDANIEQFLYLGGPGGNGKGTITHTLLGILGSYGHSAPASLLLYTPNPQHPTAIAALHEKRCVVASELPINARLDEQLLKGLTGGDSQTAHKMRMDDFTFEPQLKLWIASNHAPRIIRPDEAIKRRMNVINLPNVITPADPLFKKQVIPTEWPQILAWMLEGAVRVIERGMKIPQPERVKLDSTTYLGSQDSIGQWLAERGTPDPNAWERRAKLYKSFQTWAEANNEYAMSSREFYADLMARGFKLRVYQGDREMAGVRLNDADSPY